MSTGSASTPSIPLLKAAPEPDQVAERLQGGDWPGMELALLPHHVADDAALDRAIAAVKPGASGRAIYELVCEVFHDAGYPTQLSKKEGEVLDRGFYHGLGHGVGLEVHEPPRLGLGGDDELVAGDVIAIEPGIEGIAGIGGVRFEDLLLFTEDGS